MSAQQELARLSPPRPTIAAIGVFDGVHLGHRHLLRRLHKEARSRGLRSAAVVFRNNPVSVLLPQEPAAPYLSSLEERLRLLEEVVDLAAPLTFDIPLSRLSAREFLSLLQEHLGLQGLIMGPSFAIGHEREVQTLPALRQLGQEMDLGFSVGSVEGLEVGGEAVSSTAVRAALAGGDVERAASLLGRPFALAGAVAPGQGRGRGLGFPTVNLEVEPSLALPADGVYATWAQTQDGRYPCATSIGVRPTFGPSPRTVEGHLLDFSGDLYGQTVRLGFVHRLRDEERFAGSEALVAQLHRDVDRVRALLTPAGPAPSEATTRGGAG